MGIGQYNLVLRCLCFKFFFPEVIYFNKFQIVIKYCLFIRTKIQYVTYSGVGTSRVLGF